MPGNLHATFLRRGAEDNTSHRLHQEPKYLPFRPLIYGGDDVTFVCDGRLGLELAQIYLKELEKQHIADDKTLYSRAGVCIVKSHYPFARAYALSEALCSTAKKFIKEQNQQWSKEFSAIDWHIAASGLFGSIGDIRQREYKVNEGDLTSRPLLIQDEETQWRTWSNFTSIMQAFSPLRSLTLFPSSKAHSHVANTTLIP